MVSLLWEYGNVSASLYPGSKGLVALLTKEESLFGREDTEGEMEQFKALKVYCTLWGHEGMGVLVKMENMRCIKLTN